MAPKNRSFGYWPALLRAFARDRRRLGFTVIEIVLLVVMLGVVSAIAMPSIGRIRISASIHNARSAVISAISLGRATAINYGRPATVHLDSGGDRVWVEIDTTLAGDGSVVDTLGLFYISDELDVDLESDSPGVCFNSQGIGTTGAECPVAGAQIILSRSGRADTVNVSPPGRITE